MKKKPSYNDNTSKNSESKEPRESYITPKRLNFEAHHTFEEMNAAKQAAFMSLSMGDRFLKGLELYLMFKEHTKKQPDPNSFVLKRRDNQ